MKNFSKAVVLSVAMLVSGNAFALTLQTAKELVNRVAKLGASKEEIQNINKVLTDKYLKEYMLTTDIQKVRNFVLSCPALIGNASVTTRAKVIAALKTYRTHAAAEKAMLVEKITAATNATLAEIAIADLTQLIAEIDSLLTRVPMNMNVWPIKDTVWFNQNRNFEKISEQVIFNDAIYNRIAAANVAA
jgi:hypothetical protein